VLIASPVIVSLVLGRLHRKSDVFSTLPAGSSHLLETTMRAGPVFLLGAWGALVAYRRGDRLGRLFSTQVFAAMLLWLGYAALSLIDIVEQPDEINFWVRFLFGAAAGVGAWNLVAQAPRVWPGLATEPSRLVAIAALVALPWTLPYWWDPMRMDRYFKGSTVPLDEDLRATGEFLRNHTPARAVLAGDLPFARWGAALGGRRSLLSEVGIMPRDTERRWIVMADLFQAREADRVRGAAGRYEVTHLVLTPAVARRYGTSVADLDARTYLRRVFTTGDVAGQFLAIYEILPAGS
jgi:hypothetical protein